MIVWEPQAKQRAFMSRPEYEVCYGGAAGGGKSDALLVEALRQVNIKHYRGIIFRKTYPMLTDLIDRSREIYPKVYPGARYNSSGHVWTFKSGAKIYFGSMQYTKDRYNYQGKHFDYIAFDELTQFLWDEYSYMMSRNRPNGPGTRVYLRASCNPGGVGHGWVKDRFVTPAPPLTPIADNYEVIDPNGKKMSYEAIRMFVPATVFDNERLLSNDPMYLARLAGLPEAQKRALLYGDWDSFEGQVFTEWRNDPSHYDDHKWTHVIEPFEIPSNWKIVRGFDWGYSKPFATLWFALDPKGKMYLIREYYGCDGTPDHGIKYEPMKVAAEIKRIEKEDPILSEHKIYGWADPAIFASQTGESVSAMMEKERLYWYAGDHTRIAGKMQYHYRLAFNETGDPMLQVFKNCRNFIRTIPTLVYDDADVEDINTKQEDHLYDAGRYVLMANIIAPRSNYKPMAPKDDPLDLFAKPKLIRV